MPKATPPSVLTMDVNALTEELQSAEAKVANETASIGTASKKKHKRSAYTAAIESSPVLHIASPQPPSITPSPRPPAMLTTMDVADAVQDQINAAAEVARANVSNSVTSVQDQINSAAEVARANVSNSVTSVQEQINAAAEVARANVSNSVTSAQDQINAAVEVARANLNNSATSEVDEGLVTGGNFLEDAFGGMTLDEDVIEPKAVVSSRQGSFDATSFQPIRTPQQQQQQQQQQQYSSNVGGDYFQSPLDGRIVGGQTSILRSSINATKVIYHYYTISHFQHIF